MKTYLILRTAFVERWKTPLWDWIKSNLSLKDLVWYRWRHVKILNRFSGWKKRQFQTRFQIDYLCYIWVVLISDVMKFECLMFSVIVSIKKKIKSWSRGFISCCLHAGRKLLWLYNQVSWCSWYENLLRSWIGSWKQRFENIV